MVTINAALNTALRSLTTHTAALNTTNHNIANMNNEWYSKQIANITATEAITYIGIKGQIGTGSKIGSIERVRDIYLDKQIMLQRQYLGKWEMLNRTYESLRAIFPEIDGITGGLESQLQEFYDDWAKLADVAHKAETETNPTLKLQYQAEVEAARREIFQTAQGITNYFNAKSSTLTNMQIDLTKDLRLAIQSINQYLRQIHEYNKQIANIYSIGQNPNDILDKRNEAMNKLAELINFDYGTRSDGTVVLHINGHILVNGADGYNALTTMGSIRDSKLEDVGLFEFPGAPPVKINDLITKGQLGGILAARDESIQWYKVQLDNLASSMITVINRIHRTGLDDSGKQSNLDFFIGSRAADISVSPELFAGAKITYKHFGTNDIANIIANLENKIVNNWLTNATLSITAGTTLGRNGILRINGIDIAYNSNETVANLINKINTNVAEVSAIFDETSRKIYIFSNQLIVIQELNSNGTVPNSNFNTLLLQRFDLYQEKQSSGPINYTGSLIKNALTGADLSNSWDTMDIILNIQPYKYGTVVVDYNNIRTPTQWNNQDIIGATISNIIGITGGKPYVLLPFGFDAQNQRFSFGIKRITDPSTGAPNMIIPFVMNDKVGNLIQTLNVTENIKFGEYYSIIVGRLEGELDTSKNIMAQYEAALALYQQMQDNITRVNEDEELARARAYQRAYDASVRLLSIIDQMLNMLINRTATPSDRWE
ncbi:MAG: flagellar hook-associated protein FlgK [Candidatus Goldbacteria bacterium]|nr:flagellar hook-associated protein FlgK [Candidatus Goldiibacteriota bacterium]